MLPGLRFVLAAVAATILIVVLGFAQLVKLQVAQTQLERLGPLEARFAGLAFAARAHWTPDAAAQGHSLEALQPFAGISAQPPRQQDTASAAAVVVPVTAVPLPPPAAPDTF